MKKILTLAIIAFSLSNSAPVTAFEGDKTFDCPLMKWSNLSFEMTERFSDERHGFNVDMKVSFGSRDRSSGAGAFTDSINPVLWGDSFTGLVSKADGSKELTLEFEGTQPLNTSKISLVFTPAQDDTYKLSLVPVGKSVLENSQLAESNYAYDFFSDRFNKLVLSNLQDEDAGLLCTIR